MKKNYICCSFITIFIVVLTTASAQDLTSRQDSYWVIESNLKTPKNSIVYFYNGKSELMYKQTISGKKINATRAKVQRKLNELLNEVNIAWLSDKKLEDSTVVANRF
jgi:hypothetical protein